MMQDFDSERVKFLNVLPNWLSVKKFNSLGIKRLRQMAFHNF